MYNTWGPFVRHGTIYFCVLTEFEALNRIRTNEYTNIVFKLVGKPFSGPPAQISQPV